MLFGLGKSRRVVGIGLDGMPFSLLNRFINEGLMPNAARLAADGTARAIDSVLPTISNVAWTSFQTGRPPAEFGIFGFVDFRRPDLELFIPSANDIRCPTLWQRLDEAGKSYAALSVPQTWPARKSDNFLVSGFLAPKLDERAVSNAALLAKLSAHGYVIDVDPALAAGDPAVFKSELARVARARQATALALLRERKWDLCFVHVMDTDRLHHFLWHAVDAPDTDDGRFFRDLYRAIDDFIGNVIETAGRDCAVFLCSDHGFCELKCEVQLNRWLVAEGFLEYDDDPARGFGAVRPCSRAVALVPGRIYILRASKWTNGTVADEDYGPLRAELIEKLRNLRHPETGEPVCRRVLTREEAFSGPFADAAADIVIDPHNGHDLKAQLGAGPVFHTGPRSGMHTFDDAMLVTGRGLDDLAAAETITDVGGLLAEHLL